jgi:hypothetical protein
MMKFLWDRIQERPGKFQVLMVALVSLISAFVVELEAEQVAVLTTFSAAVVGFITDWAGPGPSQPL